MGMWGIVKTMRISSLRALTVIATIAFMGSNLFSQTGEKPLVAGPSKIEPGLELAVKWRWWVVPSAKKDWGMALPVALLPKTVGSLAVKPDVPAAGVRPETYAVQKGDAVIKIARKFEMAVWQLEQFNNLKDDRITIGQTLRIPTSGELLTMIPPPPLPLPEPKKDIAKKKKPEKAMVVSEPASDLGREVQLELENVRLQVFLDREMFSPGLIDGKSGTTFLKISEIYQRSHPDAANPEMLKAKAEAALKEPYTRYVLRADDFKFIKAPKDEPASSESPSAKKKFKAEKSLTDIPAPPLQVVIDDLVAADFLGYTSAWEFVAERFHCDEAFLHHINPAVKGTPAVGSEFQVPSVIPFEIEMAFDSPLQPVADPLKPITAAVVLVSRLEISCEGKLVAVMPLSSARPGLHGRGSWKVLDAIPQPQMATKREPREIPKEKPPSAGDVDLATKPEIAVPLEKEQYLAPGPNNPVGIIWINLAKAGSSDPLPYGLHGTSIPAKMGTLQGIGGLRLTNWDIARAARLMPAGTALQWKAQ